MKTDKSIHSITIAAVKRHTMLPFNFKYTGFYEQWEAPFQAVYSLTKMEENELPICSVIFSGDYWTLLTTRRLITRLDGTITQGLLRNSRITSLGNFKGYGQEKAATGTLQTVEGISVPYFIETGKASMVMIYGVSTAVRLSTPMPNIGWT